MQVKPVFDFSARANVSRMPDWIRQGFGGELYADTARSVSQHGLVTVCEEARCPNRGECWSRGTATFMLLGDTCTRACGFCAVKTGRPETLELDEPSRVAAAATQMGLNYIVLTSVNRDDQADGGAKIFAETLKALRFRNKSIQIELLTPDFYRCQQQALEIIMHGLHEARGDDVMVWGHNVETVPSLYKRVRKGSDYRRSLDLLQLAGEQAGVEAKSAIMLGLGERQDEVISTLEDLRAVGVSRIALGQYLRPSKYHLAVEEYIRPERFAEYEQIALGLGFSWVKAGPLVRSSYHAED